MAIKCFVCGSKDVVGLVVTKSTGYASVPIELEFRCQKHM